MVMVLSDYGRRMLVDRELLPCSLSVRCMIHAASLCVVPIIHNMLLSLLSVDLKSAIFKKSEEEGSLSRSTIIAILNSNFKTAFTLLVVRVRVDNFDFSFFPKSK
jgi:hypothetical protein